MEVIMVSRYTSPMVSSFTTLLELMLERLGLDTIPMDIAPTGVSWSTSTGSRVLKQATIPAKPRGGMGGLTNASVLAGRGDFGGNGDFGDLDGGLMEVGQVSRRALLFPSSAAVSWGFPLQLPQVRMGVLLCPTWHTLGPPLVWMAPLRWHWHLGHQW